MKKAKAEPKRNLLDYSPAPKLLAAPVSYTYHVAYYYAAKNGTGYGAMQINRNFAIRNSEDISGICDFIAARNRFKTVVLLNWILL